MKLTKAKLIQIIKEERLLSAIEPIRPLRQIIKEKLESAAPLYIVNIELGEFSAPDLDAAIQTAQNWLDMGLKLLDGTSPEVLEALKPKRNYNETNN